MLISSIKTESLETHIWGGAKAIPVLRQSSLRLKATSVETFEGFYYDSSLHTPILGVSQFAQITLPTEAEFSLAGIARYLVAGQKIDFNFEFNSVPAPSTCTTLVLGLQSKTTKVLGLTDGPEKV